MLYHYTDFAALDGIIRCAELRLNNILNMNDASEMRLFINGICKAVIDKLCQDGEEEKSAKTEEFFHKALEEEFHYSAYAACFSKYRDDAAQWDRYGHAGQGVCIDAENAWRRHIPATGVLSERHERTSSGRRLLSAYERL